MAKRYKRVGNGNGWAESPSTNTPRNAANFNIMDKGIDDLDNAVSSLETSIKNIATVNPSAELALSRTDASGTEYETLPDRLNAMDDTMKTINSEEVINARVTGAGYAYDDLSGRLNASDTMVSDIRSQVNTLNEALEVMPVLHPWYNVLFFYATYYGGSIDNTVKLFKRYDMIVYGYSSQGAEVMRELLASGANTKIFGYVAIGGVNSMSNDTMEDIKSNINKFAHIGGTKTGMVDGIEVWTGGAPIYGIFLDEYGYDYTVSRERQNTVVNYCHSLGLSVFANSWGLDSLFSSAVVTMNPNGLAPVLNSHDFILFESNFFSVDERSVTTISPIASARRPFDYYTSPYYTTYGCKSIILDYISGGTDGTSEKEIMTYSILTSLIMGANGIAFARSGVNGGGDVPEYSQTDFVKKILSDNGWVPTRDSSGVYSAGIAGFALTSSNLNLNTEAINVNDARLSRLYVTSDGAKLKNLWLTVYSMQQMLDEKTVSYNDKDTSLNIARPSGHAGLSATAARADHSHPASKFLRLRQDTWIKGFPVRTNYLPVISEWSLNGNTITISADGHSASGEIKYVWGEIAYSGWPDTSIFAGKTIEFGFDEWTLGDPGSGRVEFMVDGAVKYGLYTNTVGSSQLGFTTTHCFTYTFGPDFNGIVRLRMISYSETDRSFSFTNVYAYDVDELKDYSWYTNLVPALSSFSNYGSSWVTKNIAKLNENGTFDVAVTFSGQEAWSEMAKYFNTHDYIGKTIEIGFDSVAFTEANYARCAFTAYDGSASRYIDLANFYPGMPKHTSPVWGTDKCCVTVTMPDYEFTELRIRYYAVSTNTMDFVGTGFYMYDVNEEINVLADELVYSKTCLEFITIKQAELPETLKASTIYMTDIGCIYIVDKDGKTVSVGQTPAASLPSDRSVLPVGFQYYSATLGKPVWWTGTGFVDAAGQSCTV